jgi:hypothetical protein
LSYTYGEFPEVTAGFLFKMYAVLFTIMVDAISDSSAKENVRFDIGKYGTLHRLSLFV